MTTVRLFAHLRELAGASRVEVEGSTVGEVIAAIEERFGPEFSAGLASAAVWRNGESARSDDPLDAGDELAVIPPVSGGAVEVPRLAVDASILAGVIAMLVLVGANLAEGQAWWAAALVAVIASWAIDLSYRFEIRGRQLPQTALLVVTVLAAIATHTWRGVGLGLVLFVSVVVVMGWGVALAQYRDLQTVAPGVMVALLGGSAVGSLLLARSVYEASDHASSIFLLVVVVAAIASYLLDQVRTPLIDPFTGTALASVVASAAGAVLWNEDLVGYLLVGLGLAVGLVAGRGFGSLIRTGRLSLSRPAPGALTILDGTILAAALYYPLLNLAL
ncbi:MAG TPA: MoaD/ThiS family protein [Acidimicrobiia bacterium]|nr:MoaD/ThiS family protein [Acidimicrobiia bacterium]